MSVAPAAVQLEIQSYIPMPDFQLKPRLATETSFIFDWGVRVTFFEDGKPGMAWIYMADQSCRNNATICVLSAGRTSRAVDHLRAAHQISSPRTEISQEIQRKREANIERFRSSTLFVGNPQRFNLLLETLRIVNNNLPIISVEYE